MRKVVSLVLAVAVGITLTSCGSAQSKADVSGSSSVAVSTVTESSSGQSIDVDKGILNVTITLPKDMLDTFGTTAEEMQQSVTDKRIKEAKANDDGSISFIMSKSDHNTMMSEMKSEIDNSAASLQESYKSVKSIEANDDCTEIKIIVDKTEYENGNDFFVITSVELQAMMYQAFNGTPDAVVTVSTVDEATGEIIESAASNDA